MVEKVDSFKKQLELFIAAVFSAHGVGIFPTQKMTIATIMSV